jgi:anti-sigma regulatory factor (Ser/Thr protein kinase)
MNGCASAEAPHAWPLQTQLELAAQTTAPGVVRGHVRAVAREWGLSDLAETAELLASELATNAVLASQRMPTRADRPGVPVLRLWVTSDGIAMVIHVWDAHPGMPVLQESDTGEENGRGVMLVAALGKDWGTYRKLDGGKVVWVMIAADP